MNGFVVANRRRHQQALVMRDMWDAQSQKLLREDLQSGRYKGTAADWKTRQNAERLEAICGGCPYTLRMMESKGWKL